MATYESIEVGDSFTSDRFISDDDVQTFADITGDDNPIHVDEDYARSSRFGHRVVHGVFLLGLISKVLGRDFPGHGSVAVGISCRFLRPVPVNSDVTVEIKISEKIEKRKYVKVRVYIYHDGQMALGGEGTVIPPSETDDAPAEEHTPAAEGSKAE